MNTTNQNRNKYRNPWHKSLNVPTVEWYENDAPLVLEHRRVKVYKRFAQAFDFVLDDCCITQRAGITEAKREIDKILDGKTPVCPEVCNHLAAHGFKSISYDRYHKLWQQGLAA